MNKPRPSAAKGPKPYPRHCANCGRLEVRQVKIPYDAQILHNGKLEEFHIDDLTVDKCQACNEVYFTNSTDDQISDGLRHHLEQGGRSAAASDPRIFLAEVRRRLTLANWWTFEPDAGCARPSRPGDVIHGMIYARADSLEASGNSTREVSFPAEVELIDGTRPAYIIRSKNWPTNRILDYVMLAAFDPTPRTVVNLKKPLPLWLQERATRVAKNREHDARAENYSVSLAAKTIETKTDSNAAWPTTDELLSSDLEADCDPNRSWLGVDATIPRGWRRDAVIAEVEFDLPEDARDTRRWAIELEERSAKGRHFGSIDSLEFPELPMGDSFTIRVRSATSRDLHLVEPRTRDEYLAEFPATPLRAARVERGFEFHATDEHERRCLSDPKYSWGLLVRTEQ